MPEFYLGVERWSNGLAVVAVQRIADVVPARHFGGTLTAVPIRWVAVPNGFALLAEMLLIGVRQGCAHMAVAAVDQGLSGLVCLRDSCPNCRARVGGTR